MDIHEFIKDFAGQFDDTPETEFNADTEFKNIEEWSSMTALVVIAMVDEKYNKKLTGNDIREATTVTDLFKIIQKK